MFYTGLLSIIIDRGTVSRGVKPTFSGKQGVKTSQVAIQGFPQPCVVRHFTHTRDTQLVHTSASPQQKYKQNLEYIEKVLSAYLLVTTFLLKFELLRKMNISIN